MVKQRYDVFRIGPSYYVVDVVDNTVVSSALYSRGEAERQRNLKGRQDRLLAGASSDQMRDLVDQVVHPQPGSPNGPPITISLTEKERHALHDQKAR